MYNGLSQVYLSNWKEEFISIQRIKDSRSTKSRLESLMLYAKFQDPRNFASVVDFLALLTVHVYGQSGNLGLGHLCKISFPLKWRQLHMKFGFN